jgi:hypothetical protein
MNLEPKKMLKYLEYIEERFNNTEVRLKYLENLVTKNELGNSVSLDNVWPNRIVPRRRRFKPEPL